MSDKCNPNYLLKTYPQYKSKRYDDGICYIQTRFKGPEFGSLTFDVYVYSDTYLAACVPPRTGTSLLNRFPEKFKLHQDAQDGKILLFREEHLHELAGLLKLWRRKQISDTERERLAHLSRTHSQKGLRMISESRRSLHSGHKAAEFSAISAQPVLEHGS